MKETDQKKTFVEMDDVETAGTSPQTRMEDPGETEHLKKEQLQNEYQKMSNEYRSANERLLRLAADFENYKKRAQKDVDDVRFQTKERLLREFLPIFDNLERALEAADVKEQNPAKSALIEGVQLVQKQFLGALAKSDIQPIEAQGKPFDPKLHEAIQQIDTKDAPPGTVLKVLQRGFMSGTRVLRPALVAIARAIAQA